MTVAFVLSGGASLGAIQVGMLRALAERGVRPDVIVGTSVGAVSGAFVAGRESSAEAVDELADVWHGMRLLTGTEVRLSRGPLVDAVLASAAIPGVFPPVEWDGRLLIDGGVANNTPITHALDLRPEHVYVLPTGGPCELTAPPRGALGMLIHATSLLVAQRFTGEAMTLEGSRVTILPPPVPDARPTDRLRPR